MSCFVLIFMHRSNECKRGYVFLDLSLCHTNEVYTYMFLADFYGHSC